MQIPSQLLESLRDVTGFDKETFQRVHDSAEQVTSVRVNPNKGFNIRHLTSNTSPIPWSDTGFYLDIRPSFTFDPLFHAGCYYVQEASSMFLEQTLKQTLDLAQPLKVLDLCAAPGGKSTHIQSILSSGSLLVSNEVIRSRVNILKDNIIKWGCENVVLTNNDPKDFAKLENYFDVIVVDAPCSGSGLFRRDPEAINEWSEANVQLCSQRQQRILSDVLPALKDGGILIYSTCSYSKEEDEFIADWLISELPVAYCPLSIDPSWGITDTGKGYRFWPDKLKGEGFFLACFKKNGSGDDAEYKAKRKPVLLTKKETDIMADWMRTGGRALVKNQQTVFAWPEQQYDDFAFLLEQLKVIYAGILAGELIRDKMVPDHALAMSLTCKENINKTELSAEQAIRYLQRKEIGLENEKPGWVLVTFLQKPLGWVNILPNRINNYYPKELRILKDRDGG